MRYTVEQMKKLEILVIYAKLSKYIKEFVDRNYPIKNKQGREIKPFSVSSFTDIVNENLDSTQGENREIVFQILYQARDEYLKILARRNKEIMEKIDKGNFNTELTSDNKDYINGLNYILGKLYETPHPIEKLREDKDKSQQE